MFEIKEIAFQSITKLKNFILGVTTLRIRLEHGPFSLYLLLLGSRKSYLKQTPYNIIVIIYIIFP